MIYIRLEGPEDRHLRNSSFGGHVTSLTLQYLWPRPPGVWLEGPGCKPGHNRRSQWSPPHLTASGLIPVMTWRQKSCPKRVGQDRSQSQLAGIYDSILACCYQWELHCSVSLNNTYHE